MSTNDYASESEWASTLGISRNTLYRARKAKQLQFYRIGSRVVISRSQLEAFLNRSAVGQK